MKKIIIPGIIVIILGLLAYWQYQSKNKSRIHFKENIFAIKDDSKIQKIFMADKNNNTLLLEKMGDDDWMVNGKYKVRKSPLKELLRTLRLMKARNPVPKTAMENVIKDMASDNIKVEVYGKGNALLKSFFVGSPSNKDRGNYMKLENADQIFVVGIPGFEGYLHTRFSTDENIWRNRAIFEYEPGEIIKIRVEFPQLDNESFEIKVLKRDSFELTPLGQDVVKIQNPDQRLLASYINQYRKIHAETFLNTLAIKDSVIQSMPICEITVTNQANDVNKIRIFRKAVDRRTKSQFDQENNPLKYDVDRHYALINGGKDFVMIQQFVFDKILKGYSFFKP
jgi:Domain of unknown function (DUF4340)